MRGSSLTTPSKVLVVSEEPGVLTPRMVMQVCSDWITTPTPRGCKTSRIALANLGRELLLDLQPPREPLNDTGKLRYPDDAVFRQIADVGAAQERQHVMLAEADHGYVGEHDQLVITADFVERAPKILSRVRVVAGKQLLVGTDDPRGRIHEALAVGIVSGPLD